MSIHQLMKEASEAYYRGEPIISNEEYNALELIHGQLIAGTGDVHHAFRMFSLKKHYDVDGDLPLNTNDCIKTPKLDGAAVSLLYVNGKFQHGLTRGNGVQGRDKTKRLSSLNIPHTIDTIHPILQVTGEVVAHKGVENSRNYASGAINQDNDEVWEQKKTDGKMIFVAYNVQVSEGLWGIEDSNYMADMQRLDEYAFNTIVYGKATSEGNSFFTTPWDDIYPTDGTVYRINDNNKFNELGFTDRFPRGAIAHKEKQESVTTTLLDVEWNTGKSGKVAPVAILKSVLIGEATVSRATLNNQAYIEALDLEIGCEVEVIRAGEIIPKIIGRV